MSKTNLLIVSSISDECMDRIASVSNRLNIIDTTKIWDGKHLAVEDIGSAYDKRLDALLTNADIIYGFRLPPDVISRAPGLKWFQTFLAGVDHFLDEELVKSSIIITNMKGIYAGTVGEYVISAMLMHAKNAPQFLRNQVDKKWERYDQGVIGGATAGIIGFGGIGRNVARLCKAFGMRVLATRRTAKEGDRARYVDKMIPLNRLEDLLSESDYVVAILPSTPETNRMIGQREFEVMKQTAFFINVGRGTAVDEDALVQALKKGWIAGAGLDAYRKEPLPDSSKLWELPNAILSPHVSGRIVNDDLLRIDLFCENLKRYLNGKKLKNIVNKKKGY